MYAWLTSNALIIQQNVIFRTTSCDERLWSIVVNISLGVRGQASGNIRI